MEEITLGAEVVENGEKARAKLGNCLNRKSVACRSDPHRHAGKLNSVIIRIVARRK
jgi:hypothetical protein